MTFLRCLLSLETLFRLQHLLVWVPPEQDHYTECSKYYKSCAVDRNGLTFFCLSTSAEYCVLTSGFVQSCGELDQGTGLVEN